MPQIAVAESLDSVAMALQGRPARDTVHPECPRPPVVTILLCTYNGARFLRLQLASYEAQDFPTWRVVVSDDGSTDETLALLADFRASHEVGRIEIRRGPGCGAVANFMSLICDPTLDGDFYALSDQDDIWAADKLSRALSIVAKTPPNVPSVYCSRVRMIDEAGRDIGKTPLFRQPPQFRHALVQNLAIGNTMVFNKRARDLLVQAGGDADPAVHDWWIYLLTTAVGGKIVFDTYPGVAYRIHARNLIGSNESRLKRIGLLLDRFRKWNDKNLHALQRIEPQMLPENRQTLARFRRARTGNLPSRLYWLLRAGVYRETIPDKLGLALAALTGTI